MTRTAREVIDEWRKSAVAGDWGELASRIDYWFEARTAEIIDRTLRPNDAADLKAALGGSEHWSD